MAENKVEEFLIDLMYTYREVEPNFWILEDPEHSLDGIAVIYADPLVIIRIQVMDAPTEKRLEFFTTLLELNSGDLIHGAYGLDKNKVVLTDSLVYDTMDFTEFRAVLESFSLALSQHYSILKPYSAS